MIPAGQSIERTRGWETEPSTRNMLFSLARPSSYLDDTHEHAVLADARQVCHLKPERGGRRA